MRNVCAAIVALAGVTACSGAEESKPKKLDSVDYASQVCKAVDSTGMSAKPCTVSGGRYIDITVDLDAGEALESCSAIKKAAIRNDWSFESFWTIRFFSPYVSDEPIVTCSFA